MIAQLLFNHFYQIYLSEPNEKLVEEKVKYNNTLWQFIEKYPLIQQ